MNFLKNTLAGSLVMAGLASSALAADDTIKVGVLHSLSGTMAISETTLKDTMLMLIEEQNAKGGVLGKQLEAVVVDPASDWPLFAEKARELLTVEDVDVMFGCWTSVSRKSVLPVIEELNGLLFYPVQYEGEESSKNVFYTGAAPNQQAIPATDYFLEELGVEYLKYHFTKVGEQTRLMMREYISGAERYQLPSGQTERLNEKVFGGQD